MGGYDHRFGHSNRQILDRLMRNQPRLNKKIDDLQRQWELLNEKLSGLNEQWILETRFEEKLRLRKSIEETKTQRDQVEEQLKDMENQLGKVGSDAKEVAGRNDDHGPMGNNNGDKSFWKIFRERYLTEIAEVVAILGFLFFVGTWIIDHIDHIPPPLRLFQVKYSYLPPGQGEPQPITGGSQLHSGDYYKVQFSTKQDNSYVYIFQLEEKDITCLFPLHLKDVKEQTNPVHSEPEYYLPDKKNYFTLNENTGSESIYFLNILKQNPTLENLCNAYPPDHQQQRTDQAEEQRRDLLKILKQVPQANVDMLEFSHRVKKW